jgi:hypothetical protein
VGKYRNIWETMIPLNMGFNMGNGLGKFWKHVRTVWTIAVVRENTM